MRVIARLVLNQEAASLIQGKGYFSSGFPFSWLPFPLSLEELGHLKKRPIMVSDESTR
jgi:hypothetical protein